MIQRHAIGTTIENLASLKSLGVTPPLQSFKPFSVAIETADGGAVGEGWGVDEWGWNVITNAERAILRAFCTGLSADVIIRTYNDSLTTPAWRVYRAKMLWTPEAEERVLNDSRFKFLVVFKLKEDITP